MSTLTNNELREMAHWAAVALYHVEHCPCAFEMPSPGCKSRSHDLKQRYMAIAGDE